MNARVVALALAGQLLFMFCVVGSPVKRHRVTSPRTGITVSFEAPSGFTGPAHHAWPSYEQWSFGRDDCYITFRVDPRGPDSARRARAALSDTDTAVTKSLRKDWQNPKAQTVCFVDVSGHRVRIRAAYHVDGQQAWGMLLVGRSDINFELSTDSEEQLSARLPAFLSFVRSVRIEHE